MLQIIFVAVVGFFFLYKGIKSLREKRFTYRKKRFMEKSEEVIYEGAQASLYSWIYVVVGVLLICSPALRILFAPRLIY